MNDRVSEKSVTEERERGDIFNIIYIYIFFWFTSSATVGIYKNQLFIVAKNK